MAHRPGYLGTTNHIRGEPGTERRKRQDREPEHPPGSRTAAGGPTNQDPGDRAAKKAGDGPENTPKDA